MPIKGLTDQRVSFPRIGVLRKGAPKPETGNKPGRDLEYFRFDTDDAEAAHDFEVAYGKEPATIRCYLPYAGVEDNFQTFMEEWKAGGLVRRCDRENIVMERTPSGYDRTPHACKGEGKCACKQVGRLQIVIPELRRFAHVVALTTSIHDIIELHANLSAAYQIHGDLRGIPFILSRRPREISTPGKDGQRQRYEKWLLSIEPAPSWVKARLGELIPHDEPETIPAPDDMPLLQAPNGNAHMPVAAAIPPVESHDAQRDAPPEYLAPSDTATGARQRLAKHAKAVQALMDAEPDVAKAAELSAAISTARAVYADRNATIGDLHRAADALKALHEPEQAMTEAA